MRLTNFTIPETIFEKLAQASLANRSFFVRANLAAFMDSGCCTQGFVSAMPDLGKAYTMRDGRTIKLTVPVKFEPRELRPLKAAAKQVAEGSLSLLVTASLYWRFSRE